MRTKGLALAAALCWLPALAAAQQDMGEGSLQVKGAEPRILPLKHTAVKASISGFVAEVEVTQVFRNPADQPIEAIYVFPLPENAAVNEMVLTVADRVIRGQIKKRAEAKEIYEAARAAGKTAALLDQERPNIFTQSVANIPPGKEITVKLTYLQTLKYERRVYTYVFPMVVGPRYIPGAGVPDAGRITPPPVPKGERPGRDISITVKLDAGIPVKDVASPTHQATVRRLGEAGAEVTLDPSDSIPNKDFALTYEPLDRPVQTAVLAHKSGPEGYLTLMVQPAADFPLDQIAPKELVFALDVSGSMRGSPLDTAKDLARHCLDQLNPRDTFQILAFSSGNRLLFDRPLANTPENVARAREELDRLQGGGGTEMLEAIRTALEFPKDPGRLRIVLFMTDGFIGNDAQILAFVKEHLAGSRFFPLGVGSAPNRHLLEELAVMGRGTVQYARQRDSAEKRRKLIEDFYDRIAKPYLTDLKASWTGLKVLDATPILMPDLFAGQPVFLHGRYTEAGAGAMQLTGRLGTRPWSMRVEVRLPEREPGHRAMGPLWARARITEFERAMYRGENKELEGEITRLALKHRLVSRYTSFVAVDESPSVAKGAKSMTVPVEAPIPDGTMHEGFFGSGGGMASARAIRSRPFMGGGYAPAGAYAPAPAAEAAAVRGSAAPGKPAATPDQAAGAGSLPGVRAASQAGRLALRMLEAPSQSLARKLVSLQGPDGSFAEPGGSRVADADQALAVLALAKAKSLFGAEMEAALARAWAALKPRAAGSGASLAVESLLRGSALWTPDVQREFHALKPVLDAL